MDIDIADARSMQRVGVIKSKHFKVSCCSQSWQVLHRLQHRSALLHVLERQFAHDKRMSAHQPTKQARRTQVNWNLPRITHEVI